MKPILIILISLIALVVAVKFIYPVIIISKDITNALRKIFGPKK